MPSPHVNQMKPHRNESNMNILNIINVPEHLEVDFEEICTQRKADCINSISSISKEWIQAFPDINFNVLNESVNENFSCYELLWTGTHQGDLSIVDGYIPKTNKKVKFRSVLITHFPMNNKAYIRHYFDLITIFDQLA